MARQNLDQYIYLTGFPSLEEFLAYARHNAAEPQALNIRALSDTWRQANDHLRVLEADPEQRALATASPEQPLDPALSSLAAEVLADPVVQRSFDVVPYDLQVIELDRLSVFQKHVNMTYVQDLAEQLSAAPTPEEIFRYCLLAPPQPEIRMSKVAANGYVFVSPSNDLRFLGSVLLEPQQVTGYPLPGRAAGVIGLVAGPGSNCFSVTAYQGRHILNNGTHRAAALRLRGVTHAPVLVQRASRPEELEALFSSGIYGRLNTFLGLPRPPLFRDYFDLAFAHPLSVPRRLTQIKLTFGWESIEVPIV
jgi:hypothetical protein